MSELLGQVGELRRKVRADRDVHWFPLLVFGIAVLAAAPAYVVDLPDDLPPDTVLPRPYGLSYAWWFVVLPAGTLLTLVWYRWRGHRTGLQTPIGRSVVAGAGVLLAYLVVSLFPGQPGGVPDQLWAELQTRGALLAIGVLLVLLAAVERDPLFLAVAAVFTVLAATTNYFGTPGLFGPAAVLLAGALALGVRARARA